MNETPKKRNQAGMFLPHRQLSWAIASLLFVSCMFFSLGYFWGQKTAVSSFLGKVEEETFADKITYSLYAMNGKFSDEESGETEDEGDTTSDSEQSLEVIKIDTSQEEIEPEKSVVAAPAQPENVDGTIYVAPLIGFGTLHAANSFAERVEKNGISVIIKERKSTTAKGKKISWYQAVSQEYNTKEALQEVIKVLEKKEKIKDIRILEKKKG